jgi:CRISPR-associated exonuclease Cas4
MFTENDLLSISALQHLAFCERQWALIHLEQAWAENVLTAEGRVMHDRAHDDQTESRAGVRTARTLRIRSLRLGLAGMMDVVEFEREEADSKEAIRLKGVSGLWRPIPVEYKHGQPKSRNCDEIQLCAQALCLEEMLDVAISSGAIFYGRPRRRTEVTFNIALRQETEALAARLHELYSLGKTPPPVYSPKCPNCSLLDICKPKVMATRSTASRYIGTSFRDIGNSSSPKNGRR